MNAEIGFSLGGVDPVECLDLHVAVLGWVTELRYAFNEHDDQGVVLSAAAGYLFYAYGPIHTLVHSDGFHQPVAYGRDMLVR